MSTAPAEGKPIVALVATADFSIQMDAVFLSFYAGQVITTPTLIRELLVKAAPVVEVTDPDDLVCCPHCARYSTIRMLAEPAGEPS